MIRRTTNSPVVAIPPATPGAPLNALRPQGVGAPTLSPLASSMLIASYRQSWGEGVPRETLGRLPFEHHRTMGQVMRDEGSVPCKAS